MDVCLILICEFAFALLYFFMGAFSEKIKIDLLADFHNGMKISQIFAGIPFPAESKLSEVIALFKTEEPLKKENYRPVSLLPHLSKVYKTIIYKQINAYMESKLSKYIAGLRKLHGTQHFLVTMLEKWRKSLVKNWICQRPLIQLIIIFCW